MSRVVHWLEDAVRCAGALLYWNIRKSRYVLGRRRGRCPCQDPSDSVASGRVHCDAALQLNRPGRFRHVCPLLVMGPGGRGAFCSVPANQVRPFWGRALKFFGGAALALYLAGATVFFIEMRVSGVASLSWRQVAWPGFWKDISHERSHYFFKRALAACARRDYRAAYVSMGTALAQNPNNYDARLLMAQYAEFAGDSLTADRLFTQTFILFPQERLRTAITEHDALLAVGRHDALARQCLRMAAEDAANRSTWVGSLLLAMHLGRMGPAFIGDNREAFARLGPDVRRLAQAEALLAQGDKPAALAALRDAFSKPVNGNYVIQQIQFFLREGAPQDAEVAWVVNAGGLDDFDRRLSRCWIDRALGYQALAGLEFSALADRLADGQPAVLDKLVATLVMQPDAESFLRLHRGVASRLKAITAETAGGMWLAALACDADERVYWARVNAEKFHVGYPDIEAINFNPPVWMQSDSVSYLVSTGLFGRNAITSLYWRVAPPLPVRVVEPAKR